MADRKWVKLWETWWTSSSHGRIGHEALCAGLALMSMVRWQRGEDAAWAELENGEPIATADIAARAQMPLRRAEVALTLLMVRRTVARRADGAWGLPNCGRYQETPDAAKKRRLRGQSPTMSRDSP